MNLTEIETLAQRYAESYRELEGAVQALEDGVRTIKRKLLPTIGRLAEESATHKDALLAWERRSSPGIYAPTDCAKALPSTTNGAPATLRATSRS